MQIAYNCSKLEYYPLLAQLPKFRSIEFLRLAENLLELCCSTGVGKMHDLSLENIKTKYLGTGCKLADYDKTVSLEGGEIPFWLKRNAKDATQSATFDPAYAAAAIMLKSLCAEDEPGATDGVRTATEKIKLTMLKEPLRLILIEAMQSVTSGEKDWRQAISDAKSGCRKCLSGRPCYQGDDRHDNPNRLPSERESSTDDRESDESSEEKWPPAKQKPNYKPACCFVMM